MITYIQAIYIIYSNIVSKLNTVCTANGSVWGGGGVQQVTTASAQSLSDCWRELQSFSVTSETDMV